MLPVTDSYFSTFSLFLCFFMCLPSPLDYAILESKDHFFVFAYTASKALLELWLASLKVLWFNTYIVITVWQNTALPVIQSMPVYVSKFSFK